MRWASKRDAVRFGRHGAVRRRRGYGPGAHRAVPLHFTPIRHVRGRALPFEAVALGPGELLYLVHEGFFGSTRGRQAAIGAVEACGALPVPVLALPPLRRRVPPAMAERHVDTLIEREPELHVGRGGSAA